MGSLDQIVTHRSPGSPGRSEYPVLAAEYSGPGETELWVSVRTHTSASMRSSQPTILALRAACFGRTRARFHVAIFRLMEPPSWSVSPLLPIDLSRVRSVERADVATLFEVIDEPGRTGVPDVEASLQERG